MHFRCLSVFSIFTVSFKPEYIIDLIKREENREWKCDEVKKIREVEIAMD